MRAPAAWRRVRRPGVLPTALLVTGVLLTLGVVLQLTHGAPRLSGSDDLAVRGYVITAKGRALTCQGEALYKDTAGVRFTMTSFGRPRPPLEVTFTKGGRTLARGKLPGGGPDGEVIVPIGPVPRTTETGVEFCVRAAGRQIVAYAGQGTDASIAARTGGRPGDGAISVVSLLKGRPSLLDVAGRVTKRYGAGNAGWLGPWTWVVMVAALLGAIVAAGLALWRVGVERGRRILRPAALCAVAGFLVAFTWALLTPPFHVPDEVAHVGYTQILVETGKLPHENYAHPAYSEEERELLYGLQFASVAGSSISRPPWDAAEERVLRGIERERLSRDGTNAATASNNPPLYYLLEAPVYGATRWTSLLDQILPMRLLSALLSAATVLAMFAFLRELLPRSPWTWAAGALVVAFQPVFGFVTGGVNPDALLFLLSTLTFFAMARLLRRGITVRRLAGLGAVVAAGTLTKPLFLALVPAAAVAGLIALVRSRRQGTPWRPLLSAAGAGIAVAAVPVLLYQLIGSAAFDHGYFQSGTTAAGLSGSAVAKTHGGVRYELSYIWQLFLPRMPWMNELFPPPESLPLRSVWFDGLVGRFGLLDYSFAPWVTNIAVWVAISVLVAAVAALVVHRRRMRGRWLELGCYVLAVIGVMLVVGSQQWNASRTPGAAPFLQPRYLLPLLALYGGVVAVALRLFGRRAGPVLAVVVVGIAALHEISSMILTVARYYA